MKRSKFTGTTADPFATELDGELISQDAEFTLEDLCRSCSLEVDYIVALVEEGVLEVPGEDQAHWRFELGSALRVRTVIRLQRDLGVNLAGAALALGLLDRIAALEKQMSVHA